MQSCQLVFCSCDANLSPLNVVILGFMKSFIISCAHPVFSIPSPTPCRRQPPPRASGDLAVRWPPPIAITLTYPESCGMRAYVQLQYSVDCPCYIETTFC